MRQFFAVVPLVFFADRLSKWWAGTYLKNMPDGKMDLIPGVIGLRYAQNTGAAFSTFSGSTAILAVLTGLLVLGVLLYVIWNPGLNRSMKCTLWMVFGGGLGNLYDRIVYGYVVDYFEFQFMRFAIFNVADACICIGAVIACAMMIFYKPGEQKSRTAGGKE